MIDFDKFNFSFPNSRIDSIAVDKDEVMFLFCANKDRRNSQTIEMIMSIEDAKFLRNLLKEELENVD